MTGGPLQALYEDQRALNVKIKERGQAAVSEAHERRSSLRAPQHNISRRDSCREELSVPVSSPRLQSLLRPTETSQKRKSVFEAAAGLREELVKSEKPTEPEDTEEEKVRWENFHHKNSVFQSDRARYLDTLRRKKAQDEVAECTFEPPRRVTKNRPQGLSSGSIYDRTMAMEAKKEQRMQRIRQELIDKEMAQCSFKPSLGSGGSRPSHDGGISSGAQGQRRASYTSSAPSRPSCDLTTASRRGHYSEIHRPSLDMESYSDRQRSTPKSPAEKYNIPLIPLGDRSQLYVNDSSTHQRGAIANIAGSDSDDSEYWDGAEDDYNEQNSLGSAAHLGGDFTLSPPSISGESGLVEDVPGGPGVRPRSNVDEDVHCNLLQPMPPSTDSATQSAPQIARESNPSMRRNSGTNAFAAALRRASVKSVPS